MPQMFSDDGMINMDTNTGFNFSTVDFDQLDGVAGFTGVAVAADASYSVESFKTEIDRCLQEIHATCLKSPHRHNLLMRVTEFASNLNELHGYKLLDQIDPTDYSIKPGGMTALYDATADAIESVNKVAENLDARDFDVNGIVFIITDGGENASRNVKHAGKIRQIIQDVKGEENMESLLIILIGLNTNAQLDGILADFKDEAQIDEYISVADATPASMAKVANFVSQSISSQSQALGSGSPSQILSF